jgi:glycosyltransferase involved in cell wall biosynthesis
MRRTMPEVTVLVNTWNRRRHLELVLVAYRRQTCRDFEVVVADDGSSDGTREMVRRLAPTLGYPLRYVRHPRRGHRRARILNEGLRVAAGATVLFTDCDSLPSADLVEVHLRRRGARRILVGGYLRLSAAQTDALSVEDCARGDFERHLTEEVRWRLRLEHLKIRMYLALGRKRRPHNMGLNYSAWRDELLAVNGYDQNFEGWGGADGDLRDRLRLIGVEPVSVVPEAVVFHLWHPPHPTKYRFVAGSQTRNALWARRPGRGAVCRNGIEQLSGWREERRELRALVEAARRSAKGR